MLAPFILPRSFEKFFADCDPDKDNLVLFAFPSKKCVDCRMGRREPNSLQAALDRATAQHSIAWYDSPAAQHGKTATDADAGLAAAKYGTFAACANSPITRPLPLYYCSLVHLKQVRQEVFEARTEAQMWHECCFQMHAVFAAHRWHLVSGLSSR